MKEAINNPQLVTAIIFVIVFIAAALIYVRFYRTNEEVPILSASRFSRSPIPLAFLVVLVVVLALIADRLHTYLNQP